MRDRLLTMAMDASVLETIVRKLAGDRLTRFGETSRIVLLVGEQRFILRKNGPNSNAGRGWVDLSTGSNKAIDTLRSLNVNIDSWLHGFDSGTEYHRRVSWSVVDFERLPAEVELHLPGSGWDLQYALDEKRLRMSVRVGIQSFCFQGPDTGNVWWHLNGAQHSNSIGYPDVSRAIGASSRVWLSGVACGIKAAARFEGEKTEPLQRQLQKMRSELAESRKEIKNLNNALERKEWTLQWYKKELKKKGGPDRSPDKIRPRNAKTRVYFVHNPRTRLLKIGISENIESRIRSLSTAAGTKLELLGTILGNQYTEKAIHRKWSKYRTHGEWFEAHPELMFWCKQQIESGEVLPHSCDLPVACQPLSAEGCEAAF